MHALSLHKRGTTLVMLRRISLARGQQFFATLRHKRFIFTVRRHNKSVALGKFQRVVELRVINSKRAFIGQKHFQTADSAVHNLLQLRRRCGVKFGHAHVK